MSGHKNHSRTITPWNLYHKNWLAQQMEVVFFSASVNKGHAQPSLSCVCNSIALSLIRKCVCLTYSRLCHQLFLLETLSSWIGRALLISTVSSSLGDIKQLDRSVHSPSKNLSKCLLFSRQDGLSDVPGTLKPYIVGQVLHYIRLDPNTYSKCSPTNQEFCICTESRGSS